MDAIEQRRYDLVVCNYANGDMVGHTGVLPAAIKAVETLDKALGRVEAALQKAGGQALITADHGNVEQMTDHRTGQPHTAHTCEPVPLIYLGAGAPSFARELVRWRISPRRSSRSWAFPAGGNDGAVPARDAPLNSAQAPSPRWR